MSDEVKLTIESCSECPSITISRDYTDDSFEYCNKWFCNKLKQFVRRYVDWYNKEKFIPPGCPLRYTNTNEDGTEESFFKFPDTFQGGFE